MEDKPTDEENKSIGLVLIPGISSGEDLFDMLENSIDFSSVRVEAWSNAEDLEEMNLAELHKIVDSKVDLLKNKDCEKIGVIGKSFGGQLALTSKP